MGRYLVIEDEAKFYQMINQSILEIDPQAEISHFATLNDFEHYFSEPTITKKSELTLLSSQLKLCIIGFAKIPLKDWKKKLESFKVIVNKEIPLLLAVYESSLMNFKFLQSLQVFNYLFKPFDPLILKETLFLALQQNKLAMTFEMKSQKATAYIGLLKEVELQALSELGFITLSNAPIPLFSVSRYLSPLFAVGKKQSIWAQCLISTPHPQKPGFYINKFQFYGVTKEFLSHIRKFIVQFKQNETSNALWHLEIPQTEKLLKLALIGLNNNDNQLYKKEIEAHFKNLKVEFLDFSSNKNNNLDFKIVINLSEMKFEQFKDKFNNNTQFFILINSLPDEETIRLYASQYKEIFIQPYDRGYFYKKLKSIVTELIPYDLQNLLNISCHEKIKAANKAKITDINELYINFNYSRELDINEFREFVFLNLDENQSIEIPAYCHFKEKNKNTQASDPNIFFHQFFFFAMSDHYLKEIRLWLLHNYIVQNSKD